MDVFIKALLPVLESTANSTSIYKCRVMWYAILCVRLLLLFAAELPFSDMDHDFACNGTVDSVCTKLCYNDHFNKPMTMLWNFIFILVLVSVVVMELASIQILAVARKNSQKRGDINMETIHIGDGQTTPIVIPGKGSLNFHNQKGAMYFYLLTVILRIAAEAWFVYALLHWNLPALESGGFHCPTTICSGAHFCVIRGAMEKRTAIYALVSLSAMVIASSVGFCLYFVIHYMC